MAKSRTTISVEHDLIKQAQDRFLNISNITERAIREKLGRTEVEIIDGDTCEFCGVKCEKETRKKKGLIWLWPDEKWICPRCWKTKSDEVKHGKQYV